MEKKREKNGARERARYSKNPHSRTCGLRTPRLKFGKKRNIYKNTFSLKIENCSYIKILPFSV